MVNRPQQLIRVGEQQVALPPGVSLSQWTLEKYRWQNPRLRSLMGCIKLLEGVLESNYAILHCSPARLHEIWRQVRQVSELIRSELSALLEYPSVIPQLEQARQSVQDSLAMLEGSLLRELEQFPGEVPSDSMIEVRKLLCVSIGKLQAFLQDTFSEMLAADPRSFHDADYFLSRRFSRDIEEAEWLHASVQDLKGYLRDLEHVRHSRLTAVISLIRRDHTLPIARSWDKLEEFLIRLTEELTPRLREMLALRGIRFYEMEILDQYAQEIPTKAKLVIELGHTGRKAIEFIKQDLGVSRTEKEQNLRDLVDLHAVLSRRIVALLGDIDRRLQDLWVFIPIWQQNIEKRRAMMLRGDDGDRTLAAGTVGPTSSSFSRYRREAAPSSSGGRVRNRR